MKRIMMQGAMIWTAAALLLASCSAQDGTKVRNAGNVIQLRTQGDARVFASEHMNDHGRIWIPAERAAALLNYRYDLKPGTNAASIGFSDPLYTLAADSKRASIGDQAVTLREAPRMIGTSLYVELGSLSQLIETPVRWDARSKTVVVAPRIEPVKQTTMDKRGNTLRAAAAGSPKAETAIAFAKKFVGTPYRFDAEPYAQSDAFDCSSFMQHVFKHVGIELPRSAQAQSRIGQSVSRDKLAPGDLVFFYTPGRYASRDIVGHVGMYLGNNQVIQTYGEPGVTITRLDGDWDKRFLFGRRVL
ncbi:C40 family peptidase [Paenibacillus artemisiicola]|nr:NlpC/P60 family protein [Paenibacillus artemisiicola]